MPQEVEWSPDGRFFLDTYGYTRVRDLAGADVGDLSSLSHQAWAWSPGSDRLASGGTIATRDGQLVASVALPEDRPNVDRTFWLGDGTIVTQIRCVPPTPMRPVTSAEDPDECVQWWRVDPEALTAERMSWHTENRVSWSPDGGRLLVNGELRLADGTLLGQLLPPFSLVSPRYPVATVVQYRDQEPLAPLCGDKYQDVLAIGSLANLTSELEAARLPGNGGFVLRGAAGDMNLERWELDYARLSDTGTWYPIGAASDAPVAGDAFTVWVPPGPGTFVVRLRVLDRAGHSRVRTRTVSWDRLPALTNFTQSDYYLFPEINGVKDDVVFRYLVAEPTRLDVRIVGPDPPTADAPAAREVLRRSFEYPVIGAESFTWDGRDEAGQVAPDGRYTVYLNELPFRVEFDNTPPEIGFRFEGLYTAQALLAIPEVGGVCRITHLYRGGPEDYAPLSSVAADKLWHVVDANLKFWELRRPSGLIYGGAQPVFVGETDSSGAPVLDGGLPRVLRDGDRPADVRQAESWPTTRAPTTCSSRPRTRRETRAGSRCSPRTKASSRCSVSTPAGSRSRSSPRPPTAPEIPRVFP